MSFIVCTYTVVLGRLSRVLYCHRIRLPDDPNSEDHSKYFRPVSEDGASRDNAISSPSLSDDKMKLLQIYFPLWRRTKQRGKNGFLKDVVLSLGDAFVFFDSLFRSAEKAPFNPVVSRKHFFTVCSALSSPLVMSGGGQMATNCFWPTPPLAQCLHDFKAERDALEEWYPT